ncbi:three component ABC system middle component [Methanosarcina mazei]|uniref:Uncharacterized protein n=1 Tax=Methanosarcina mazei TaxID=2209 RepID=A0A0F8JJ27_METMZ|nr:three component ABC system middle component [Methanosarcina mazei]MCB5288265.1 DUF6521 family protein [Candidatus Cloacimonadota bacterium]KKG03534.1 hypothetical protein DU40_10845 [Methanosarcina mazei]KKG19203.1 hypothetical protein DU34_11600 [Methanosarcina mazei]KKG75768.1 hypothetical protein DU63_18525 [Methanosarcina mazei]KKG84935.1 hypothetical protein DU59_09690 [Methanosarcina mazei]
MRPWDERSTEETNLLNPAFLSIISYQCIKGYNETEGKKAPYVLPFLVTSLILHKRTRESLPRSISSHFTTWITQTEGAQAKIGYADRTRSIVPCVKEALTFGLANQLFTISDDSFETNQNISVTSHLNNGATEEVIDCFKKAYFCGRWLARAGKIETIMSLLGVKP